MVMKMIQVSGSSSELPSRIPGEHRQNSPTRSLIRQIWVRPGKQAPKHFQVGHSARHSWLLTKDLGHDRLLCQT